MYSGGGYKGVKIEKKAHPPSLSILPLNPAPITLLRHRNINSDRINFMRNFPIPIMMVSQISGVAAILRFPLDLEGDDSSSSSSDDSDDE